MTINKDYFKGLNHFANIFSEHVPKGMGLVYGGGAGQERTDVSIVLFHCLDNLFGRL
jgi:hypothetical protein